MDILSEVASDDVFYDIGANIGVYSCIVGSDTDIVVNTFEPIPENIARLSTNMNLNNVSGNIFQLPLSDKTTSSKIRQNRCGKRC